MARPLRIEFEDAVYHVTSRGDRREPIYRDDGDRHLQLDILAQAMERFDAQVLAFCQMGNHYHLVLHTRQANLSRLMRHVNGVYTQAFNRRHGLVGHLFQGRFKAILVDRNSHLLALCRYVERNPVAAGLVHKPQDWPWASCRAHVGLQPTPPWLDSDGLHGYLVGKPLVNANDRKQATRLYAEMVGAHKDGDASFWHESLRGQIYLGDEGFVQRMQSMAEPRRLGALAIPKAQRKPPLSWPELLAACDGDLPRALLMGYRKARMTVTALARESGISPTHVGRLIAKEEKRCEGGWGT